MRHIIRILLRDKLPTALNIFGLSVAFAVFVIMAMQIRFDLMYNRYNQAHDRIYALSLGWESEAEPTRSICRPIIEVIRKDVPSVEAIATIYDHMDTSMELILHKTQRQPQQKIYFPVHYCDADITNVFTFEFTDGDKDGLSSPNGAIISEAFAEKWYGETSPVGSDIEYDNKVYTIKGVYKTLPANSTLRSDLLVNIGDTNLEEYDNYWYKAFIKIPENTTSIDKVSDAIATIHTNAYPYAGSEPSSTTILVPLSEYRASFEGYSHIEMMVIIILALSVMVLASINFINLTMSLLPLKMKSINISRIVGASISDLRVAMVKESLAITLTSYSLSLIWVELFKVSSFNMLLSNNSLTANVGVYIITTILVLLIAVVSVLYPAYYATSLKPAIALSNGFSRGQVVVRLKRLLITFQFFVAITFISATIFIQQQHNLLINRDNGYNKQNIISTNHGWRYTNQKALKEELLKNHAIEKVAFSYIPLGIGSSNFVDFRLTDKHSLQEEISIAALPVSFNFLDAMGIEILEGRDFVEGDQTSQEGHFIMSQMVMEKYGYKVGQELQTNRSSRPAKIVGICNNVNLSNSKTNIQPYGFYTFGVNNWDNPAYGYIKITNSSTKVIDYIKACYKRVDPESIEPKISYLVDQLDGEYKFENRTKKTMQFLSMIAIVIALVGVFGVVLLDSQFRRKEIGIRKVHGASTNRILFIFSTEYIKIILVAFVLSTPLVYHFTSQWLNQFPYKIDLNCWVFAASLLIVLILTTVISIIQSLSAARENPIEIINK